MAFLAIICKADWFYTRRGSSVVERHLGKMEVESPILSPGSWREAALAQLVERIFRKDEVPGPIPGGGSNKFLTILGFLFLF